MQGNALLRDPRERVSILSKAEFVFPRAWALLGTHLNANADVRVVFGGEGFEFGEAAAPRFAHRCHKPSVGCGDVVKEPEHIQEV